MKLASLFQDHAVLQRHKPIPVWGTGTPGENVAVRLAGREVLATVDNSGRWFLRLPPMTEGGPYSLTAEAPSGRAVVNDILVGEVWICSGQSNMEWTLEQMGDEEPDECPTLAQIRLLRVVNPAIPGRADTLEGSWELATPKSLGEFSAVGGYFGRRLQETLNAPIGLICNAWGGTRIQAWMSREALMLEPEGQDEVRFYESYLWAGRDMKPKSFEEWEASDAPRDTGNLGLQWGWASPEFDDSALESMTLPAFWQQHGHDYSGVFWFRRSVEMPAAWIGKKLELSLGAIDKYDETWVNGCLVGSMGRDVKDAWCTPRLYIIASSGAQRLVVAVRAQSHIYSGGFAGPADAMWIAPVGASAAERLSLAGEWACGAEQNWGKVTPPQVVWGPGNPNSPGILFESRIAPLVPYAFRGVIWYQGELNVGEANLYRRFIAAMIHDWRRTWGAGEFPFLQVQLANYLASRKNPSESQWAALREAQASALSLQATGMAVAIDIGDAHDIHPRNKRDVAARLAQCALHGVYHRESVPMGPLFWGMNIEAGGKIRCFFHHVAGGLVEKGGGPLRHFALAGQDRVFHWASAEIEGETVVVSCPEVSLPYAVRYAWADNPEGCNLGNALGLPAAPFRSDAWPVT